MLWVRSQNQSTRTNGVKETHFQLVNEHCDRIELLIFTMTFHDVVKTLDAKLERSCLRRTGFGGMLRFAGQDKSEDMIAGRSRETSQRANSGILDDKVNFGAVSVFAGQQSGPAQSVCL
jgi:hypothetical protein